MENSDTNELIEQYLRGTLPPDEMQSVETRLATDADFRAEVELHRQVHQEFADARKLQLRDTLREILHEPASEPGRNIWRIGLILVLVVVVGAWVWWYRALPGKEQPAPPALHEPSAPPPVNPGGENKPSTPGQKPAQRPIATATGPKFAPNRDFEARLGNGGIRSTSGNEIEMQSPATGADFQPGNGVVKINFKGAVTASADTARHPLVLKIYTNQTAAGPLLEILPTVVKGNAATEKWTFTSYQKLRLEPGLYYFTVERQADEDMLFVGKFTVGANTK